MTEAKVYADGYTAMFAHQEEFLEFLKRIAKNALWDRRKSKELRLLVVSEGSQWAEQLRNRYVAEGQDEGIIADTVRNTGLALKVRDRVYPVRDCAIRTILDRAGISGPTLRKLDKNVYARILNNCLQVADGEALLRISEGKVSAVLSGGRHGYAALDMEQVFKCAVEYLNANFRGCTYLGGFFEHHMASSLWELGGEGHLLDAYRTELRHHGRTVEEMKPVVRVTTSDTGASGANIYPMLLSGERSDTVSIGRPLRLEHKAGATVAQFEGKLKMLYGKYQLAAGKLTELLDIDIMNPGNCMIAVMKQLGIAKRLGMEATELFKAQYGSEPCTAHDIYFGISEVLHMLACDGASGSRIAVMEETIARALTINWAEYDLPGEYGW